MSPNFNVAIPVRSDLLDHLPPPPPPSFFFRPPLGVAYRLGANDRVPENYRDFTHQLNLLEDSGGEMGEFRLVAPLESKDCRHLDALFGTMSTRSNYKVLDRVTKEFGWKAFQGAVVLLKLGVMDGDWVEHMVDSLSPKDIGSGFQLTDKLRALDEAGCNLNSGLSKAIESKNWPFVEALSQAGACLEVTDSERNNAFHVLGNESENMNFTDFMYKLIDLADKSMTVFTDKNSSNELAMDLMLKHHPIIRSKFIPELERVANDSKQSMSQRNGALCLLGISYIRGFFVHSSMPKAMEFFGRAAHDSSKLQALFFLGWGNLHNWAPNMRPTLGKAMVEAAARDGMARAQYEKGHMYRYGFFNTPIDLSIAIKSYTDAAEQGVAIASYELGLLAEENFHADIHTPIEPAHWFAQAAEQGHSMAQYKLAVIYITQVLDIQTQYGAKNPQEAKEKVLHSIDLLTAAAKAGLSGTEALLKHAIKIIQAYPLSNEGPQPNFEEVSPNLQESTARFAKYQLFPRVAVWYHAALPIPKGYANLTARLRGVEGFSLALPDCNLLVPEKSDELYELNAFLKERETDDSFSLEKVAMGQVRKAVFRGFALCIALRIIPSVAQVEGLRLKLNWARYMAYKLTPEQIDQFDFPLEERLLSLKKAGCDLPLALRDAIKYENLAFIDALRNIGESLCSTSLQRDHALHVVCRKAGEFTVEVLIEKIIAYSANNLALIRLLNAKGESALPMALKHHPDLTAKLKVELERRATRHPDQAFRDLANGILGMLYKFGELFEQNYDLAAKHFQLAQESGNSPQVSYFLTDSYYWEGKADAKEGRLKLFNIAANAGFAYAQWDISEFYEPEHTRIKPEDAGAAPFSLSYIALAAEQGLGRAIGYLAYYSKIGLHADYANPKPYYRIYEEAAHQGEPLSQLCLGEYHVEQANAELKGHDIESVRQQAEHTKKAVLWLERARDNSDKEYSQKARVALKKFLGNQPADDGGGYLLTGEPSEWSDALASMPRQLAPNEEENADNMPSIGGGGGAAKGNGPAVMTMTGQGVMGQATPSGGGDSSGQSDIAKGKAPKPLKLDAAILLKSKSLNPITIGR